MIDLQSKKWKDENGNTCQAVYHRHYDDWRILYFGTDKDKRLYEWIFYSKNNPQVEIESLIGSSTSNLLKYMNKKFVFEKSTDIKQYIGHN